MKLKFEKIQTYITMFLLVVQFTRLLMSLLDERRQRKQAEQA